MLRCHRCGEPYQRLTTFGKPIKNGAKCADCGTTFCLGFTGREYLCTEHAIARLNAAIAKPTPHPPEPA